MAPLEDMGLTWVWYWGLVPMQGRPAWVFHQAEHDKRKWDPCRPGALRMIRPMQAEHWCFFQKYKNCFFWTYKNFDQLKWLHYTIKTKSWFDSQNRDLTGKYQVETTFFTKNLICSYGHYAPIGCSGFPYRPKKNQVVTFLVVLFDRVMSI